MIALSQYCGTEGAVRDDRVQLVSTSGEPIVTLRGDGVEGGSLTSRFATVMSHVPGAEGIYVYDLESGDFDQVAEGASRFGGSMHGHGDLLTWATPVNNRHGMKLWAVELD